LRQVPNAPGLQFRVYLRHKGWSPSDPDITTDFSEFVVQESLGNIDWTLERGYAQLTPGDVQFQIRDNLDQFETVVRRAPSPCEVQIWAAPAWGGAIGDWAMLFHGYIEPSDITRGAAEPGDGGEPVVPVKDVYAKSYLSARLDAVRALPLETWTGVLRLEEIVRMLGDGLISVAGHEPIDYDIQVAMIPTKDDRLVLSAWNQQDQAAIDGPSWIIRENDSYWWILQWHWNGTDGILYQYQLDKHTYKVTGTTEILRSADHAEYGRFHYVSSTNVLLSISRREAWPCLTDFTPEVLKELILIDRRDGAIVARWRADAHYISTAGPLWWRPVGYCAVACPTGGAQPQIVLWMNCSNMWGASHIMATLSLVNLVLDLDCGWHSGITAGYVAGGAICANDNWGRIFSGAAISKEPLGTWIYLDIARSDDNGVTFTDLWSGTIIGYCDGTTRQDPAHRHARQAGGNIIFDGEDNGHYWTLYDSTVHDFALQVDAPIWLQEYRHDHNDWPECIGLIYNPPYDGLPEHWHVVHFYVDARISSVVLYEFYNGRAPTWNQLAIFDQPGYFTKLNWTEFAERDYDGTTGHYWGWRDYTSSPIVLIASYFWPAFDLDAAPPTEDETARAFVGRLAEATGHMILFPGRATPTGLLTWRVRPRHTQPPDYCLTAREVLADGISLKGERRLRVLVTTQGSTYAYPDTEALALDRQSELTIGNDGIPASVADDFAYWLYSLFNTQNRQVCVTLDCCLWVEVGDSVDVALGLVDYLQGVVTRQSLASTTGRGECELLCAMIPPSGAGRLTPKGVP